MCKIIFFIVCFSVFNICRAQNKEVTKLVDQFIDTLEAHSFMRSRVDFDKMRQETKLNVRNINSTDSLMPTFKKIVAGLNDHHSSVHRVKGTTDELALIKKYASTTYAQLGMPGPNFQHRLIEDKYAYINVPGVDLEHRMYIDTLQKQLLELDGKQPKAWIIDLTENEGGSCAPMIIPFHALIDTTQTFCYFDGTLDKDGKEVLVDKFKIPQNGLYIDNDVEAKYFKFDTVQVLPLVNNKIPVIVLISGITGSSGEIAACHFLGQKNVTVIGTKSAGLTSGNELYYVDKGYSINLMTALLHNRKGKSYDVGERINPDITITYPENIQSRKEQHQYILKNKSIFINKALEFLTSRGI